MIVLNGLLATMQYRRFLFISSLLGLQACTGYQPPAPVYGSGTVVDPYQNPPYSKPLERSYEPTVTETTPLASKQSSRTESVEPPQYSRYESVNKPLTPAVVALISESERYSRAGDLDAAVARLERALRITPRNPEVTYKLAKIRLQQEKPVLAEDLAKKAALLAAGNPRLKRQCWLLIAQARRLQHDLQGAREAELKARQIQ